MSSFVTNSFEAVKEDNKKRDEDVKFWGTKIEERRLFDWQERKQILQKTKGHCACCGKALTTKTMTVDHCVPLSRGGTNNFVNLVALCIDCNEKKGNLFYFPGNYYAWMSASMDKHIKNNFVILSKHGYNWFKENKDGFDFEKNPLVTPTDIMLIPVSQNGKYYYSASNVVDIFHMNTEKWATVEGVTGLKKYDVLGQLGIDKRWSFFM